VPRPPEVWGIALVSLVLHLLPQPGYGFHRDELLYLAMGQHLDLFRMQFPPLIALLAELARSLPLDLLRSVRLLPALASAALPLLAAVITRELGGRRRVGFLAALAVLVAPLFLRAGVLFQPVVFEQLWWCLATLALVKLLNGRDRRWWLVLGLALGLSALTKFSVAFLVAGVLVAIAVSLLRQDLRTLWPWLAAALSAVLALPSLTGQIAWGWPFLAQARELRATQLGHVDPLGFFLGQFRLLGPGGPLWLIGLVALLASAKLRPFRPLGLLVLTVFLLLLITRGKDYYFGPLHPLLIAVAVVMLELWLEGRRWRRPALAAVIAFLLLGGVVLLPLGIPILPPESMARYAASLGLAQATRTNTGESLPLPQDFADMTGWREQVAMVARVFRELPPAERSRTTILAVNYGRAGALALFGPELGLPYPISRNGDFYQWSLDRPIGETVIVVGGTPERLREYWGEVREAARSRNPTGVDEEQDVPIFVCRKPKTDLRTLFRSLGPDWG